MTMIALHNSRDASFRRPFGAATCGTEITLAIVTDMAIKNCVVEWRSEDSLQAEIPMHGTVLDGEKQQFEVRRTVPLEPTLLWYRFRLETSAETMFYGCHEGRTGGEGVLAAEVAPYQITVYRDWQLPEWYRKGILYQIFVDRFARGSDWAARIDSPQWQNRNTLLHLDWFERPHYLREPSGSIAHWDIYGGTLRGIAEKLPYLESLGVGALYLNPIFEASSNHKYDTGDYHKIDPAYGDDASFDLLVQECKNRGVHLILDGVFSHTGADSRYFNRFDRYDTLGAYQSLESPFYAWYRFTEYPQQYESWWGIADLPNVEEQTPSYREFICGVDGVLRSWLHRGIKGWRLDVADELPDDFIAAIRAAAKAEDKESVIVGEVWEDASNKISYDCRRRYLLGDELDATMNYPFAAAFCDFLREKKDSSETLDALLTLLENYPRPAIYGAFNLVGTHDTARVLTLLSGGEASSENRQLGKRRLMLLSLIQMTFPGVPAIYYGDEAGVEGWEDPDNRATYPWGAEDEELLAAYRRFAAWRREYEVLVDGEIEFLPVVAEHALCFRRLLGEEEMLIAINRSAMEACAVDVPLYSDYTYYDLFQGEQMVSEGDTATVFLKPLAAMAIYRKRAERALALPRCGGVLMPLTSLPGPFGCGDMDSAFEFIDFLHEAGQRVWQVLSLNPLGPGYSPYSSPAVMAGNPLLLGMEFWQRQNLLSKGDLKRAKATVRETENHVDYEGAATSKASLSRKAFDAFEPDDAFANFCADESDWLEEYCVFMALKAHFQGAAWQDWPEPYRTREENAIEQAKADFAEEIAFYRFLQFSFEQQWQEIRAYAAERGITLVGNLPLYVDANSVDTWCHIGLFRLRDDGNPAFVGGVPPDAFAETGQYWGNPLYDWGAMEADGYSWWKQRLRRALQHFDFVRLDHFRGFEAYWAIDATRDTATEGYWWKGPGKRFFEEMKSHFGALPCIAENLGFMTPDVEILRKLCGFPGMAVHMFGDLGDAEDNIYCTGTHDNETLLQWYRRCHPEDAVPVFSCRALLELIYASAAPWVILPLQDILLLDGEARLNTPGTVENNWRWRLPPNALSRETITWLKQIATDNNR